MLPIYNINKNINLPNLYRYNYIYNPRVSLKGLSESNFDILPTENLPLNTQLVFEYFGGEPPDIELRMKINNNTSKILLFNDVTKYTISNKIYHIIVPLNSETNYGTKDTTNTRQPAIIEYLIHDGIPVFNQIIHYGSLCHKDGIISQDIINYYNTHNNESIDNFTVTNPTGTQDILAASVTAAYGQSSGFGYKLNSSFFIKRSNLTSDYLSPDCFIECKLVLNINTVIISGGLNYLVGDTFEIHGGDNIGIIKVKRISSSGSILETEIINYGSNFITEPSVIYMGLTGYDANITINNDFSIDISSEEISVIDSGTGYCFYDSYIGAEVGGLEYEPEVYATAFLDIETTNFVPFVNDTFDLYSFYINYPGNNISSNTTYKIIMNNSLIEDNNFITINFDNLIDMLQFDTKINEYQFLASNSNYTRYHYG